MTNWSNRRFSVWPFVIVAVLVAPLLLGGVRHRKEAEYGPASPAGLVTINIQNRELSRWGAAEYIGGSRYGAPFDLYIFCQPPEGAAYDVMRLDSIVISDGTTELRRVEGIEVPLEEWVSMQRDGQRTLRAANYALEDALPTMPRRITVRATGRLASKAGALPFDVVHSFDLVERDDLHVGERTFALK